MYGTLVNTVIFQIQAGALALRFYTCIRELLFVHHGVAAQLRHCATSSAHVTHYTCTALTFLTARETRGTERRWSDVRLTPLSELCKYGYKMWGVLRGAKLAMLP